MAQAKIIARGGIEDAERNLLHKKALIIEDNKDMLSIIGDSFISRGFEILKTPSGKEGIELAKKEIPDVIILDILLDDIDGFEVLTILREDSDTHLIPIVIYTNLQSTTDKMAGIKLGADAYYQKTELSPLNLANQTKELLKLA
ncbi:MAG: Response regulator receiver modulated diguanylate cyclase [Parcubacteria group bacterium GW2011_GWD2_38_12]|uniref:Response regulatory domain-containing protein n=1 Tax=Candidatus Azambacteria bacterium RIFCSPLOWO2_01_FULL_37_9 TaxID=1797297 RepID=A0A1F5C8B9_9BACT|nr:MAG: Response regulator receiver modulated diguanylate cyclase [Parcubacteria group bacterium GW2011_GWC2_36_17]KKQ42227.1 MAG: Response regulator receiver modulated diguanylate cyclase [Parcubacteria group bacterium GW2011_GWE2_37_8]KKQ52942.1 MAG: Response regulator receiver modulated diguanylate cyclase [Parcubacteria group bacterium GW2011_GWD2_38_12]KKQ58497.1 MAG: Response regulator receiver modulated diguanylate cyclase [Parcubacteria group bacterium GW2011_GWC1_38_17]KKQ59760.1 MAG: 